MIGEVIAIGDELTSGQRLDTNTQWISQRLENLGVRVLHHSTVGDDLAANVEVFRHATARADLIVTTGGLGPTADDLTREAMAAAGSLDLVEDAQVLADLKAFYASRQRTMPPRNAVQAKFPQGSTPVPNPHGTAPGIDLTFTTNGRRSRVFALPGVPAEMKQMWSETVEPAITELLPPEARQVIVNRRLKAFGIGESDAEQRLPDLMRRGREPRVGITVSQATITFRVTAAGRTEADCHAMIEPTLQIIRDTLGAVVFGEEDDELQHAVAKLLAARQQTVAVAEIGTAGKISRWLHEVDESHQVFLGSYVTGHFNAVRRLLPSVNSAAETGKKREETVLAQLAEHTRASWNADFGLATGEIPAADDGDREYFIALAGPAETIVRAAPHRAHPNIVLQRSAKQALNLLRRQLLDG